MRCCNRDDRVCNCRFEALGVTPAGAKLSDIRIRAVKAVVVYEQAVQSLMKTLGIPLDPKGHKSAIQI